MAATNIIVEVADRFAVAKYTAPDTNSCTVILYSDSGRTVKVADTDSSLFTSSDNDLLRDTTPGYNVGRARQFRFGTLPKFGTIVNVNALDGKNYSRTLQVATTYYYTICGTNGQFTTQTIPFGRTLPPARPILADGLWGFPTLDYTNRNKQYIDPSTGTAVQLTNIPRDDTNDLTSKVPSAVGVCTNWNNPTNLLANTADATYNASTSDRCLITGNIANSGGSSSYSLDWFKLYINGSTSGGVGDDTILQACITLDGVACTSNTKDIQLTTTAQQLSCYPFGTNAQDCGSQPAVINTWSLVTNNISYAQVYNNTNFGVFVWKKGGGAGTINLRNVKFEMGRSYESAGYNIGNQFSCGFQTVAGATGNNYWLCDDKSSSGESAHRFTLNSATGAQGYLGRLNIPTTTGLLTSAGNGFILLPNSQQFDHADPTSMYNITTLCAVSSESGSCASGTNGHTLVKCTMPASGNAYYDSSVASNTNVSFSRGCTLLNPLPNNLEAAALAFNPAFDSTKYTGWGLDSIQNHYVIMHAIRGNQNSYGWQIVADLNTGAIIAMRHTALGPLYWWEGFHNVEILDDTVPGWAVTVHHGLTGCSGNSTGCGPYTTTLQTTLNNTDAAGTNVTISVAGDPTAIDADTVIQTYVPGMIFQIGTNACTAADKCEIVQVVSNNGSNSITISRGYGVPTNGVVAVKSHAIGDKITAIGTTGDWLHTSTTARSVYWNFLNDPNGQDLTGFNTAISTTDLDGAHEAQSQGSVVGQGTQQIRFSAAGGPNGGYGVLTTSTVLAQTNSVPVIGVPQNAVFAGTTVNCGAADFQKHPQSPHNTNQAVARQNWGVDASGYQQAGSGDFKITGITQVASCSAGCPGSLYSFASVNFHRKYPGQQMTCGMFTVTDVSGANSVIDGTSASNYQFCHALNAGECVSGSVAGTLYMNCPFTSTPTSCCTTIPPASWSLVNAICLADWPLLAESMSQFMLDKNQSNNELTRNLSSNLTPFLQQSIGATALMTPDGAYIWTPMNSKEMTSSELLVKVPPFLFDNIARNDWVQVPVKLGGKTGATHTIIKFGTDTNLFCTSRQEKCVAYSSTYSQANPFYYEFSEAGSYTGVNCSTGCTIVVPAISGQPLDYQVFYRDGSNVVLGTSNIIETAIQ